MASLGDMIIEIGIDSKQLQKGLDKVRTSVSSATSKLSKVGEGMKSIGGKLTAGLTLPIVGAGAAAVKLASDFEESMNKVDVAFKDNAKEIKKWSKTTLTSFGIAQGTALDMSALFGDMATGMGLNTKEASKMSRELVGLAGDLSSFKNIKIEVAETALKSIFTGETESLKNLGIVMTQANLEAWALNKGLNANIKDMSEAEKVQLRYAFVMDKTKNAQGDFARTQGGAANQMRIFQESLKQLGQQLGQTILPTVTKIIKKINSLVSSFSNLSPKTKKIIVVVAGLLAVLGPLFMIVGSVASGISALIPIIGAISAPILAWVAGIALVVAALVYLWKNNEEFRDKIMQIWESIKSFLASAFEAIKVIFEFFVNTVKALWDVFGDSILATIKQVFNAIALVLSGAFDILKGLLDVFIGLFTGDWEKAWEGIKSIFLGVFKIIKANFGGVIDWFASKIEWLMNKLNVIKTAAKNITGAVKKAGSVVAEGAKKTGSFIAGGAKSAGSAIKSGFLAVTPFAEGGIVTQPTLAMIGEGGESEAVIPLSKLKNMGMGKGITVNITGNNINDSMDVDVIADKMVKKLQFAGVY